ncbi:lytic transglycosylase domain-containing protein [Saccharopolyspora flava]|uniref:Membrane-bound lytic murein transglycosylase B n=1 Tax=Saccharopolyspora flava TaxID=95161 RepID=A0A1I6QR69_9PSEU|nr:lytic transglycosylase domain-containing protein [Saccharopolyspora flava]SFS54977.1 Membrane-bound lytic murein transglycosylase B [Saccharopolyspora flava]
MANRKNKIRRKAQTRAVVGDRARKWLAATAMAPVLALPAALVSASALPTAMDQHSPDLRQLGVSGNLPQAPALSPRVLDEAADPEQLAAVPQAAPRVELPTGELGIPEPVLAAYMQAARSVEQTHACGLHWSVLASIGRIESGHARGGDIDVNGTTTHAILGPRLSGGPNIAAIPDTDAGRFDGDPVWDRAVGPMQFIPSTWRKFATDGNEDGVASPHNLPDAAAAAGTYLCSGGGDLSDPRELAAAVFRYNHSESYVRTVMVWADAYRRGVTPTPAELAPAAGDVLAGERVSADPGALAMPAPAPLTVPGIEPVPPVEDPQPQALPPLTPAPEQQEPAPAPVPESGLAEPPLVPPVEPAPPQLPGDEPTTKPAPTPTVPTTPPSSETPTPEPSTSEPAPSAPPSSSSTPTPEPSTESPSSEPSAEPPTSQAPGSQVPQPCDTELLDRGEFSLLEPEAGEDVQPGESLPLLAQAGGQVFTDAGGVAAPCTVPEDYQPR